MELNQDPHVPDIKSLALLHVIGDETPGVMKPNWFIRSMIKTSQNDFLRRTLVEGIALRVLKAIGNPFARKGLGEALWGGFSMHYYDRQKVRNLEMIIVSTQLSRRDRVIIYSSLYHEFFGIFQVSC